LSKDRADRELTSSHRDVREKIVLGETVYCYFMFRANPVCSGIAVA